MLRTLKWLTAISTISALSLSLGTAQGASAEFNPVRAHAVSIGPEAHRLIVGFKANAANSANMARQPQAEAQTTPADLVALTQRVGLATRKSRQISAAMHVVFLTKTLYGADVETALNKLRADPAVKFAEVDQRRYPHALPASSGPPTDPLFGPSANSVGQWYMLKPSIITGDAAATDAVSAWMITTGSTGVVIADVDTGVRFDHPDLGRAQFGGSLLPGYDFVDRDFDSNNQPLLTFLIANDGDGWDADPSDPGDWVSATDFKNLLFPVKTCGDPNGYSDQHVDSSWHGTRVAGVLGALTNNLDNGGHGVGIAGMTWNPYILPVRALGKCGGYDSDIITGMQWAAGVPLPPSAVNVPSNPYPASIINLSLGGSDSNLAPGERNKCSAAYRMIIDVLNAKGVLIVASAGNGTPTEVVDVPGVCSGVLTVGGLRHIGTKVSYSSFGTEVGISAPAGNCVTSTGCLRPIDTTVNFGLTIPGANGYTSEVNPNLNQVIPNLGTSFSAPIVSGIAALMRSVNANLSPAQLITRIQGSATKFPQPAGLQVCLSGTPASPPSTSFTPGTSGECACPNSPPYECGTGMVNALAAVQAAQAPIAAVIAPSPIMVGGAANFDASGSAASCGRTIKSYAWTIAAGSGFTSNSSTNTAHLSTTVTGNGPGTITLIVTDDSGVTDMATLSYASGVLINPPPVNAGPSVTGCPAALAVSVKPIAPTVTAAFAPGSVDENVVSTLTITLTNPNPYALTQATLSDALSLSVPATPSPNSTCLGATINLSSGGGQVTMSGAIIPAASSCTVTVPVVSATAGTYAYTVAINDLLTGPGGGNAVATTATLTVTTPRKSGGGALGWPELLFAAGLLGATQLRRAARRSS